MSERFTQIVTSFHGRSLPEPGILAGHGALVARHDLKVPLPPRLTAIASRHHPASTAAWHLLTPRHATEDTLGGHLELALKWEGVNLAVLAALFAVVSDADVAQVIRAKPTGVYARRLWFLFEWLTGRALDLPDLGRVRAVPVLDPDLHFGLPSGPISKRHKIIDNLPGTRAFCPLVRRTPALDDCVAKGYDRLALAVVSRTHPDLISRAAAFLLRSDSRSSFTIEGEQPSAQRATRWGRAISEAGQRPLSLDELERLQRIVIGDARFVRLGLRTEDGFVGAHDRTTREPIPDHISAKPDDLSGLMTGLIAYGARAIGSGIDPVVAAAAMAFGFVYIHPFEDGNGRLHRWLIHHVLASAGYNPPGVEFPVSAAILRELTAYRTVLESHSKEMLPLVVWKPTAKGNVQVLSDTAPWYRYFDATLHAEFLYRCVAQTVESDLPHEVEYLQAFDDFARRAQEVADMPTATLDLLHRFLRQGGGRLSRRAREREFAALTDAEVASLEAVHADCFAGVTIPE